MVRRAANVYGGWEFGKSAIDSNTKTPGTPGDVSSLNVGADMQVTGDVRAGVLFGYS